MFRTIVIAASAVAAISIADATAQAQQSTATDFSSAQKGGFKPAPARAPMRQAAPRNVGGGKNLSKQNFSKQNYSKQNFSKQNNSKQNNSKQNFSNKNLGNKNPGNKNVGNVNQNFKGKAGFQGGNPAKVGLVNNNAMKFKPGPGPINKVAFKPANGAQFVKLGQFNAPLWKGGGPKKIWWGNSWKVWVPLTALGVVALGGAYYYPDAYLTVARPYCDGITPDGCRLNWQRVDFEDGGGDWQCVQYCRRAGPPPARTVAFVAPPAMAQGAACELSIFSEPNFSGTNATANTEQPRLGEIGWQNQIASVKVATGTWDFFTDPEFTGETMRLQPGDYGDLGPEWSKRASSFMCVQP